MSTSSDNINELATALAKAQGEITAAMQDKVNPHFKSSYASLNSVWDACRVPLSKNGLSIIQTMQSQDDALTLVTTLAHCSGQYIKSFLPIATTKATPQALGSAITYMRRYSLAAIVGVAPDEDDDANEATGEKKSESKTVAFTMKSEGFDAFVQEHDLLLDGSEKAIYVKEICAKQGKSFVQIVNSAMLNRDKFLIAFEKWNKERISNSVSKE